MRTMAILLLMLIAAPTAAHMTPNSELVLDFSDQMVVIDAIVPEGEYVVAAAVPNDRGTARAARWIASQLSATSADRRAWQVHVVSAEFVQRIGPPDLHTIIRLRPPTGADPRRFTLRWSAVVAQNPDHFALILIGNDHGSGTLREDRRMIGAVRRSQQSIIINRGAPTMWGGFTAAFRLGMAHIARGTDHMMFLLALLLPAPLLASGGRWGAAKGARATAKTLIAIITAFTLGHSLTLILAALGGWRLPVAPVEIMIALSILVSAIHAMRPICAGKEALVAAGFGLIHGLAFATLIGDAGIGGASKLLSILGFNLGIETIQLLVVALVVVPLMLIVRSHAYRFVRIGGACMAAVAALGWLYERALGGTTPIADWVEYARQHALIGWITLVALCALLWIEGSFRLRKRQVLNTMDQQ